ncbi:adenylyltransferase/cytidyltransferase family protein [Stutzerimonas nitrititolerans]|uniref:adenylyltransferase/cytidyltransferase family protein n=1 Tax=Stutzerimonas nitrititolerans TaxID=2482751 RepID=UPI0028B0FC2F|nr:adenylyltransferase/cytidyltransferase family protein [Stutzerimonas nitrititolerans]
MIGTVITYGTFDMFHIGHLRLLERMSQLGDRVVVGVSTDEFNAQKGKRALIPYADRKAIIEALKFVDLVIPETSWEQKPLDIDRFGVDAFVIGDDWQGHFDDLKAYCEVVYLERTAGVSSSELKMALKRLLDNDATVSLNDKVMLDALQRNLL